MEFNYYSQFSTLERRTERRVLDPIHSFITFETPMFSYLNDCSLINLKSQMEIYRHIGISKIKKHQTIRIIIYGLSIRVPFPF